MGNAKGEINMPVYHQMGHQSDNLIIESDLSSYHGAILSPVNYTQEEMVSKFGSDFRTNESFELVFDPQLYFPRTERQKLLNWQYFPQDVDTINLSESAWWTQLVFNLTETLKQVRPNAVCTPVVVPRSFSNEYYKQMAQVTIELCDQVAPLSIEVLQTVVVGLSDLADYRRVMSIASIITATKVNRAYIVFSGNTSPRRELDDPEELKGAMLLIDLLKENGINVLVGYCSSDMVLWKHAGAESCASGKFFNLRRFTSSRWDDIDGGGGQIAYWFEESLLAFLRASDISRIGKIDLISESSQRNPFSQKILAALPRGEAWLGLGWRQFMYWFSDIESRLVQKDVDTLRLLRDADRNWGEIEDSNTILEERRNDGRWIRQWLRAAVEFQEPW